MTETRLPRAIIPGDMGEQPDLYDVENSRLVATAATPELARWLCRQVWEQTKQRPLPEGEKPVDRALADKLDRDLLAPHLPGCRVLSPTGCDCADIIANRESERPELAADPFDAARRYLSGPAHNADPMTSTRLLHAVMERIDSPEAAPAEPVDTAAYEVTTTARSMTASEYAEQLVWDTRRLIDAQWDVARSLAGVQATSAQPE